MSSNHEYVGIAQIVFYIPAIPVTVYVLVKNWSIRPRISRVMWFTLSLLAIMRFTGGILVVLRSYHPYNTGLTIATVVLLNVGLVPLIMSTFGMIGLIISSSTETYTSVNSIMKIIRILFITSLILIISGGALSLSGHPTGDYIVRAAYILYATIVCLVMTILLHLQFQKRSLASSSLIYLHGATILIPCLILRILYGVLSAFLPATTWSPLVGSAVAFTCMALIPEYITIAVYAYLGLNRARKNIGCVG